MANKFLTLFLFISLITTAQVKDKAEFRKVNSDFYINILKDLGREVTVDTNKLHFKMVMDGKVIPQSEDDFTQYWHNNPLSQGNAGTCWAFSTTSYFESEVKRITDKEVKLSEIYTVYWEYVEKAKEYIRTRGESYLGEGSEANATTRIMKMYGTVPESAYEGKTNQCSYDGHSVLFEEFEGFLHSVKENNSWNEKFVVETIKSILDKYLGVPPTEFEYDGNTYSPKSFLKDYLKINPEDYVDVLSLMEKPYWEQVEYDVPDNWWNSEDYYNVPLDDFMELFNKAIKSGYTVCIGGDVSEPGKVNKTNSLMIPTFDIPSEYIDEYARQFRFSNKTTTDDHGIHVVGYTELNGENWYLIKDSGAGAFTGSAKGYFFYHEDYVKLKIVDFMVHKDVAEELLAKMKK